MNAIGLGADGVSDAVYADFINFASMQAVVIGSSISGSLKLQSSNDFSNPTNWSDIDGSDNSFAAAGNILTPVIQVSSKWIRGYATTTSPSLAEHWTIACNNPGASPIPARYFLCNSGGNVRAYYVWLNVNGTATDPHVAGRIGVPVVYNGGDSANKIASDVQAALNAVNGGLDFSCGIVGTTVSIIDLTAGTTTDPTNGSGSQNTTWALAVTQQGSTQTGTITTNLTTQGN